MRADFLEQSAASIVRTEAVGPTSNGDTPIENYVVSHTTILER
jgi:hypothetical protein